MFYYCLDIGTIWFLVCCFVICFKTNMKDQSLDLLNIVIANINDGVFVCDADNGISHVNKAFATMTGYAANDLIGNDSSMLSSEQDDILSSINKFLGSRKVWQCDLMIRCQDETTRPFNISVTVSTEENSNNNKFVVIVREPVNSESISCNDSKIDVNHDNLTGLPNKYLFNDRTEQGLIGARRSRKSLALLLIGLDRFTIINDGLGHDFGDFLLKEVALRLKDCIRDSDTVAQGNLMK